jgi:hypothetical protein
MIGHELQLPSAWDCWEGWEAVLTGINNAAFQSFSEDVTSIDIKT